MGKALIIAHGDLVEAAAELLISIGHEIDLIDNVSHGWEMASKRDAEVVLLAAKLAGGDDGLALLPRLQQLPHRPEVVVIASSPDPKAAEFALRNGAYS